MNGNCKGAAAPAAMAIMHANNPMVDVQTIAHNRMEEALHLISIFGIAIFSGIITSGGLVGFSILVDVGILWRKLTYFERMSIIKFLY
jgi:hypothetical protein